MDIKRELSNLNWKILMTNFLIMILAASVLVALLKVRSAETRIVDRMAEISRRVGVPLEVETNSVFGICGKHTLR